MFKATKEIYDALKAKEGLKVFIVDDDYSSAVWLQFPLKNGPDYRIFFMSRDDGNDVCMRVFGLVQIDEERLPRMLPLVNRLNSSYRFLRFSVDDAGALNVDYDLPCDCKDPAACAFELVVRCTGIIDEVYPLLMSTLWAN